MHIISFHFSGRHDRSVILNKYYWAVIAERKRWEQHVAKCGREKRRIEVAGGGPEGKRPLGILKHRWEDNIKTDRQEVDVVNELNLSGSGWRQVAGSCECGNEPSSSIKCGEYLD